MSRSILGIIAVVLYGACPSGILDPPTDGGEVGDALHDTGCDDAGCDQNDDPCDLIVCPAEQTCSDGRCRTIDQCEGVVCTNPGDVCDPRDGMCHAGAADDDGDGVTIADGDCDDSDPGINPSAAEICDGVDQDCDHEVDEGFPDSDGDGFDTCGFGDPSQADCDDEDSDQRPGLVEACDGVDNDCDGQVDEGMLSRTCTTACGTGEERCEGGAWVCSVPEVCECTPVGRSEDRDCGFCGSQTRTCGADLRWSSWGVCDDPGECEPSTLEVCTTPCSTTGSRACDATCRFGACVPPAESCNAVDDDCDGGCDEGCRHGVHRSYNNTDYDHLYTDDMAEATCCGYYVETENFFYLSTTQVPGTTALYNCYFAGSVDHMLTIAPDCEGAGFGPERTVGYIATSAICGSTPLYRLHDPVGRNHFYTIWEAEVDSVMAAGWDFESIIGYVWLSP